jgi:2-aminoadipate transaminase
MLLLPVDPASPTPLYRVFRSRMRAALQGLRGSMDPAWAEWAEPRGGYLIWLRLSFAPAAGEDVDAVLAAHGVSAAPGRSFFGSGAHGTHLRLSISTLSEGEIVEGIRRLARALEELYSRRQR